MAKDVFILIIPNYQFIKYTKEYAHTVLADVEYIINQNKSTLDENSVRAQCTNNHELPE